MNKFGKIRDWISERGIIWSGLYISRLGLLKFINVWQGIVKRIERSLIDLEKRKFLTGPGTITSQYHTIDANRIHWNSYDWSDKGEEWTKDVSDSALDPGEWKTKLINQLMWKYIKPNTTVLEIGPGAGRWTEHLLIKTDRLILADISEKCLEICEDRFQTFSNIDYYLIENQVLDGLETNSVDFIWSYDVFVHINPTDTERYIKDFRRILKPGGYGIIHHSGSYPGEDEECVRFHRFRSFVDKDFFAYLVEKEGLILVEQNDELVHVHGDIISIFKKPKEDDIKIPV